MALTEKELTRIYNDANGLDPARHNSITTERIFTAMRAMDNNRQKRVEDGIRTMVANGKCSPEGDLAQLLRKLG